MPPSTGRWPISQLRSPTADPAPGESAGNLVDLDQGDRVSAVAELPGLDEKNIEISVSDGSLSIRGEKKEETEEKKEDYYLSERRYGSLERRFQLPEGVDVDKIEASVNKGVLKIVLPKTAEAQKKERKITIKAE